VEYKSYFVYENYLALVAAVSQKAKSGNADALEDNGFLTGHFRNFFAYVNGVCNSEVGIHLADYLEGQAKQDRITELDRMRSKHHDAAIASASAVNRIAAIYGVGPIYTGDPSVRREVAAFCMEAVRVLFENRR
jgi:hypothetical protein